MLFYKYKKYAVCVCVCACVCVCLPEIASFFLPTGPCVQAIAQEKQKVTFMHLQRVHLSVEEKMNFGVLQDCYVSHLKINK